VFFREKTTVLKRPTKSKKQQKRQCELLLVTAEACVAYLSMSAGLLLRHPQVCFEPLYWLVWCVLPSFSEEEGVEEEVAFKAQR